MPTCYMCKFAIGHHSPDCELATDEDRQAESHDQSEIDYEQDHDGAALDSGPVSSPSYFN